MRDKVLYEYSDIFPVGETTTKVIMPYIDDVNSKLYSEYHQLHSGLDIKTYNVYSRCTGSVLHIGKSQNGLFTITIQYNSTMCLRYGHMSNHYLAVGNVVVAGELLGECLNYVHYECITTSKTNSIWPVRLYDGTWWKHDPTPTIDGSIGFDNSLYHEVTYAVDPDMQTVFEEE